MNRLLHLEPKRGERSRFTDHEADRKRNAAAFSEATDMCEHPHSASHVNLAQYIAGLKPRPFHPHP
jgi:hypothetical protein